MLLFQQRFPWRSMYERRDVCDRALDERDKEGGCSMNRIDYDLTIIGGGSGGLTAARIASSLGAHVLLIDKERLGGDCLYSGCVPSKSLLHIASMVQQARETVYMGVMPSYIDIDMARVAADIQ